MPVLFAIAWLVGLALRERAEQAEAAEARAAQAERERETRARIAVAEERARIARELHDVVAHAVSVMVLQVGAVRHGLPAELAEDREALEDVERAGRDGPRRDAPAARRDAPRGRTTSSSRPQPGLGRARAAGRGDPPRRPAGRAPASRASRSRSRAALDLSAYRIVQEGLTNALKHAHATRADVRVALRAARAPDRGPRRRPRQRRRRTGSGTASSASASA